MILEKRRGRWWVYLDPDSAVESELLDGFYFSECRKPNRILSWLHDNAAGKWRTCSKIYFRRGDYRQFITVRFSNQEDALMFVVAFEQQAPRVQTTQPDWKLWSKSEQENPVAMTFEPWESQLRYFRGGINPVGDEVAFCWSMSRNQAGNFLSWESHNTDVIESSVRAFRKRKSAKALALSRSDQRANMCSATKMKHWMDGQISNRN
jgi:hypothetical protein